MSAETNVSNVTMLVCSLLTLAAFLLRRFTPSSTSWWHTSSGTTLILFATALLTGCTQTIMAKGLTLGVVIAAVGQSIMSFTAVTSPAQGDKPSGGAGSAASGGTGGGTAALLLVFLLPFFTACACWKTSDPQYNSAGCIIARGTVQCGLSGVASALVPIIESGIAQDVQGVINIAKQDGTAAGGCLLADLAGLMSPAPAPGLKAARVQMVSVSPDRLKMVTDGLAAWKAKNGNPSVCHVSTAGAACL